MRAPVNTRPLCCAFCKRSAGQSVFSSEAAAAGVMSSQGFRLQGFHILPAPDAQGSLEDASIVPSESASYEVAKLQRIMATFWGVRPVVKCSCPGGWDSQCEEAPLDSVRAQQPLWAPQNTRTCCCVENSSCNTQKKQGCCAAHPDSVGRRHHAAPGISLVAQLVCRTSKEKGQLVW